MELAWPLRAYTNPPREHKHDFNCLYCSLSCFNNADTTTFYITVAVPTFIIKHSGGLCVSLHQSSGRFQLTAVCNENFLLTSNKNLKHMATGKCVFPESLGNEARIKLTSDCSNEWTQFEQTSAFSLKNVKSGSCIHPLGGSANPGSGVEIILHSGCDETRLEFKFMWGNLIDNIIWYQIYK